MGIRIFPSIMQSSLPSVTSAAHIVFGFLVFWILQGWAVASETFSPDTPNSRQSGRFAFVAGQGIALLAQSSLALLCAHALSPIVDLNDLAYLPLGLVGALFLTEFVSIITGHTLPAERRPLEGLSFSAGRDLMLRHASGLFLGQGLLATVQGSRSAALQAGGAVLGWGLSVALWESGAGLPLLRKAKWVIAPLALFLGLLVVRQAWRNY